MGCPLFLCVDIGTSSLKASYIDGKGRSRGFVRVPYTRPGPADAADWEAAFTRALGALRQGASGFEPAGSEPAGPEPAGLEPDALCISGNGPTLVPLTTEGRALSPLHWYRGGAAAGGAVPQDSPSLFLPTAAAFLGENPRDYERTRYFLSSQEWLSFRCGAEPVTVLPAPAYEPYYWDDAQCAALGLDRGKFPPFAGLGSFIGKVSAEAAETFGLRRGLPIIAGGPDFIMALIGVGAVEPGIFCDRAGSSEGINLCSAVPFRAPELRTLPHVEEGLWNLGAILPSSGRHFDWFRELTGQTHRDYGEVLGELLPPPVSGGGEGRGVWETGEGILFPWIPSPGKGISAFLMNAPGGLRRAALGRAVLESLGFSVREALDTFRRYGFPVKEMRLSGGQGKSPLWNQFKADITGCTLLAPEIIDGELAGDACAASLALGEYGSLSQAAAEMVRIGQTYRPSPQAAPLYEERFRIYRELREKAGDWLSRIVL
jgi:xylulokinase